MEEPAECIPVSSALCASRAKPPFLRAPVPPEQAAPRRRSHTAANDTRHGPVCKSGSILRCWGWGLQPGVLGDTVQPMQLLLAVKDRVPTLKHVSGSFRHGRGRRGCSGVDCLQFFHSAPGSRLLFSAVPLQRACACTHVHTHPHTLTHACPRAGYISAGRRVGLTQGGRQHLENTGRPAPRGPPARPCLSAGLRGSRTRAQCAGETQPPFSGRPTPALAATAPTAPESQTFDQSRRCDRWAGVAKTPHFPQKMPHCSSRTEPAATCGAG